MTSNGTAPGYDGHVTLFAPGIARVHLRSNRPNDPGQLTALEDTRRVLRASIGVGDIDAAHARQTQSQHLEGLLGVERPGWPPWRWKGGLRGLLQA